MSWKHILLCSGLLLASGACGDSEPTDVDGGKMDGSGEVTLPQELGITADWLHKSLSYVDMNALRDGASSRDEVVTHTLDLSEYELGPLELELTPDGRTALVSVSVGFFAIPISGVLVDDEIPTGDGTLLFVDVDSATVDGALNTGEGPMGIAFTPDGERAFVAHFDSGTIAVVDVAARAVLDTVEVGQYAEEIAVDDTGSVGIVGYSTDGSVRTFATDDVAGSLSAQVELEGDSAGVAFFPGTKLALVVQAPNALAFLSPTSGYTLVDVEDPSAPVVLEDVRFETLATGYPAVPAPARDSVLVPVTVDGRLVVREYVLEDRKVTLKQEVDVTEGTLLTALGVAYDGDRTVTMTLARDRKLAVTDLDDQSSYVMPWLEGAAGPADMVVRAAK